jgi:hypothetical protein
MKKLTIEQLNELEFDFTSFRAEVVCNAHEIQVGANELGENFYETQYESVVMGRCIAKFNDIQISFSWTAQGGKESIEDAHDFTINISDSVKIKGFLLIDKDGEELTGTALNDGLTGWENSVNDVLPTL